MMHILKKKNRKNTDLILNPTIKKKPTVPLYKIQIRAWSSSNDPSARSAGEVPWEPGGTGPDRAGSTAPHRCVERGWS